MGPPLHQKDYLDDRQRLAEKLLSVTGAARAQVLI
jgi:hypothetical protein